jgi:LmbE family N-acetylglucosaminyl deacetylase
VASQIWQLGGASGWGLFMSKVLVVAPHADDETLGCGGTILKHIAQGDEVHWLLVTGMSTESGFDLEEMAKRRVEIEKVEKLYGFSGVYELCFPPAGLDTIALSKIIGAIAGVVKLVEPELIYTTYRNDAHSDHEIVYDAVMSSSKSFRYPYVRRVLAYETLSETDFGLKPEDGGFRPNVFFDISEFLEMKLRILDVFSSELGVFPFPRSRKAIEALASLRGVQCGCYAAEAFMLIKEINH